jgi:hypothetical protein
MDTLIQDFLQVASLAGISLTHNMVTVTTLSAPHDPPLETFLQCCFRPRFEGFNTQQ